MTKEHSEKLIAKYGSPDKELMLFDGDHNSVRPTKFYGKVLMFFHQALQCQGALIPDEQNSGSYEIAMEAEAARCVVCYLLPQNAQHVLIASEGPACAYCLRMPSMCLHRLICVC